MSNVYSLDALRADMDQIYAPLSIDVGGETLVLRSILRLNESERKTVMDSLQSVSDIQDSEEDPSGDDLNRLLAAVTTVLYTVTDKGRGSKLIDSMGGDMALSLKVMEIWTEATQPGEAQPSPTS